MTWGTTVLLLLVLFECAEGQFKLVDSSGSQITSPAVVGLLLYNGGTVCRYNGFNHNSANAICKLMGFDRYERWRSGYFFSTIQEGYQVTLKNVRCSSADWNSCSYVSDGVGCSHYKDVFLACGPEVQFKLVNSSGSQITSGGVEGLLLYNGGTVCGNGFNGYSAYAICRQMGFVWSKGWRNGTFFSIQKGYQITLNDVYCYRGDWSCCSYNSSGIHDCEHQHDVLLTCDTEGQFKLVNSSGSQITSPGVEGLLIYDGGTVCDRDYGFNYFSAHAICKLMGFDRTERWRNGKFFSIQDKYRITLDDISCSSANWSSCTYRSESHYCDHYTDVFLACGPEGQFKLVDSSGSQITSPGVEGLLIYNGGTVCDDGFNYYLANAICKLMGFDRSERWRNGEHFSIQHEYQITLDDISCSSADWSSCTYRTNVHDCRHQEDVFLRCGPEEQFKLVNSLGSQITSPGVEGLLIYNGGTVCGNGFNYYSAHAICKLVGFDGSEKWSDGKTFFFQNKYQTTLDDVSCNSGDWNSCSYKTDGVDCGHQKDVFLTCGPEGSFKLVNSSGSQITSPGVEGLLIYNGGTVCDDGFNYYSAHAICKLMGFDRTERWRNGKRFSIQYRYQKTLNVVSCSSVDWSSCSYRTDRHNCKHEEDIFLTCGFEGQFKLVNSSGSQITSGGVEGLLIYDGGTVNSYRFSYYSAYAICRLMGFIGYKDWRYGEYFTLQSGHRRALANVVCSSADWNSCSYISNYNVHYYSYRQNVFLTCATEGQFKLVNSSGSQITSPGVEGLLIYNGGTVCDDSFDYNSAHAICKLLGFDRSERWRNGEFFNSQDEYPIALDNVDCSTDDWSSCSYRLGGRDCGHEKDVFLTCGSEGQFKMVNSSGSRVNSPEVEGLLIYNGGTVCDDEFNYNSAHAICKLMGFVGSKGWRAGERFPIQQGYRIALDNVECSRDDWRSCSYLSDYHDCDHQEDVFLTCDHTTPKD